MTFADGRSGGLNRRALLVLVALSAGAAGCATAPSGAPRPEAFPRAGAIPRVSPEPAVVPAAPVVAATAASLAPEAVMAVLATARGQAGVRYVLGGASPAVGFDCSGLVEYVLHQHGVVVPRTTADQFAHGLEVDRSETSPGDLIFFSTTGPGPTHVGIVLEDRQFIHAPGTGAVVRIERFDSPYWTSRFLGTRRPLAATTAR